MLGFLRRAKRASTSTQPTSDSFLFHPTYLLRYQADGVYFDLDNDGFAEKTAWVRPDDGFLVRDLNANGTIDNITEMFGNATTSGFVHLAALDSNADGKINVLDTGFGTYFSMAA
jgi:hypothetical protein